jgi:hypothetical protein
MSETNGHTAGRLGKVQRWFLRLRRLWNPWLCPRCGADMKPIRASLPPQVLAAHMRAGTLHMLDDCFRCPCGCHEEDECIMITW